MHAWFRAFCILVVLTLCRTACLGGGGPKNVLLVVNLNSPVSQSIGDYYQQKRGIPARNVCKIRCSTDEWASKTECETNIVTPIRNFLSSPDIHGRIDYIVLTQGIPLKASYNDSAWWGYVSVPSVLNCVGEPSIAAPCTNPYGPTASPLPTPQYFTHQTSFGGKSYYVVTCLAAYTEDQVHRMIDDAAAAGPRNGLFLLDGRYETPNGSSQYYANDRLRQANHNLHAWGYTTYYDDVTFDSKINDFVGGQSGVMGYFSWGSNENSYSLSAYTSNGFLPGSIADSYVSTSGRTFISPQSSGQSLIADLIPQGVSGCTGYVSEPGVSLQSYPTTLFDRYVHGYNMGESFFAANPRLYWKTITIGDPLMAPYATPPTVTLSIPGAPSVHGRVTISATATDASGIGKVEFYVDDLLKATCNGPPYQFTWDTTNGFPDGQHIVEAIAYENTPVYTQGMASVSVNVCNVPQDVATIGQIPATPLGAFVRLKSKDVVAGTDAFTDGAYICEPDHTAGIRVIGTFHAATGTKATVVGDVATSDGDRVIMASAVTSDGVGDVVRPLAMPNRSVANRGNSIAPEYAGLRIGLSNASMLVRSWGRVEITGTDTFTISDGSMDIKDAQTHEIRVSLKQMANPPPMPPVNSYVFVTGVSCYVTEDGMKKPAIRPRFASDIVQFPL